MRASRISSRPLQGAQRPPDFLFRSYTEPDLLAQWMGPRTLTLRVDRER